MREVLKVRREWTLNRRVNTPVVERRNVQSPAKDATCYHCKQKEHYNALSYAKTIAAVSLHGTNSLDFDFLVSLSTSKEVHCLWFFRKVN